MYYVHSTYYDNVCLFCLIALTNMFLNYVAQTLKADLYPASLTGYSMSLDYNPSGVVIRVNGYSDEDVMEQYLTVLLQGQHVLLKCLKTRPYVCVYLFMGRYTPPHHIYIRTYTQSSK